MSARLDIDLLRSFATIADLGTMSAAARRLGRTQAAISMQVKRLEAMAGQALLLRSGRGVALTLPGERLLAQARRILRAHDEALAELGGHSLSGRLSFGCPEDYAGPFLPPLLRGFAQAHPQVAIEVVCAQSPRLLEQVAGHRLDVALVSRAEGAATAEATVPAADGGALAAEPVLRWERLVWVAARGSPWGSAGDERRDKPGDGPAAAAPLPLALTDPDTLDHQAALAALARAGRPCRVAYASAGMVGLVAVVRSGQAIAVLTETAVPPDLQILPATPDLPALPRVGLVLRTGPGRPTLLRQAFEAHVRATLPTI